MKKICLLLLFIAQLCIAQDRDRTIATIDNESITVGEVLYAYNKNRADSTALNYDSLDQYLDRYINFKLKVIEARAQGFDTTRLFQNELNGYLAALKKPYAEGIDQEEKLTTEAYERMQINIKASHILLKVEPNAPPQDTLNAYFFLDSLRSTVNNAQEFAQLAKTYSEDGSAENGGKLGWFSVFMMVYPFESEAYKTDKNQVSHIVRTQFGYHLIFVEDKIKNPGKVRTSHIFLSNRMHNDAQAEQLANTLYDSLKNGKDWNEMARLYSDDNQTKMKGGALPFAGLRQLPDDFLETAFKLKKGEISSPTRTDFGWHIIRLDTIQPLPELSTIKQDLKEQIARSGRNELTDDLLIEKLKKDYGYQSNADIVNQLISSEREDSFSSLGEEEIFSLESRSFRVSDFLAFNNPQNSLMKEQLSSFEKAMIIKYADSLAPLNYPEYGYLRQEYEEGLLLFEIMQKEVWNKALEDSVGQRRYYQEQLEQFTAPKRLEVFELTPSNNQALAILADSLKSLEKKLILERLESLFKEGNSELKIVKTKVPLSEIASFEAFKGAPGSVIIDENKLIVVIADVKSSYFEFDEIRGLVISGYQDELDHEFVSRLRSKHEIKKDQRILRQVVNEYN